MNSGTHAAESMDGTNGFGVLIPFANYLGLHVAEQNAEHALLRLDQRPELLNSWGVMNGGVIMTMLDFAMGAAVRGQVGPLSVATMDISIAFMSPARGDFVVEGRVLKGGKSTFFCEAEARSPDGSQLFAKGIGTLKRLQGKK